MSEDKTKEVENKEDQVDDNVDTDNKDDYLIHRLEKKDFANLKTDISKVVAKKIHNRIQEKKSDVINKLNGIINNDNKEESEEDTKE
jgi:hypothetical protein